MATLCCLWSKDGVKHYPLSRYVVDRDGNGNVIEIVTKELINKKLLPPELVETQGKALNDVEKKGSSLMGDDVEIFTHVRLDNNRWVWHQEVFGKKIPGSDGKSPKDANRHGWSLDLTPLMVRTMDEVE